MPAHSREEQEDEHFDDLNETFVRLKSADLIAEDSSPKTATGMSPQESIAILYRNESVYEDYKGSPW